MNTTEFLQNRGWKLYRTRFEGKQAQWVSPYDGQIYQQRGAYSDEKKRIQTFCVAEAKKLTHKPVLKGQPV